MFQTLYGSSLQLSISPASITQFDLNPTTVTAINQNIHTLGPNSVETMFADFDTLFFVDCTASDTLDTTCSGATTVSTPIYVQNGVV
jgi:hypothetical protein